MTPLTLSFIIVIYGTIQSVFGVGLLVFGTPTLLLLGIPFDQTLSILLPCSMVINLMQVLKDWRYVDRKGEILCMMLPMVALGLWLSLLRGGSFDIKIYIGSLLLITAALRMSDPIRAALRLQMKRFTRLAALIIGFVHGTTNMGGGLLSVFASSLYDQKPLVRANIAFAYLLMAGSQLLVLGAQGRFLYDSNSLVLISLALVIYLLVGRRVYQKYDDHRYQQLLTILMGAFGLVLAITGLR